jgi:hypothetical protein
MHLGSLYSSSCGSEGPRDKMHEFVPLYTQVFLDDKKVYSTRSKPHNSSLYWNASTDLVIRAAELSFVGLSFRLVV